MNGSKRQYKALRVCELPNAAIPFPLYIEQGGAIVPYSRGKHVLKTEEKLDLLQNSQFVLFVASEAEAEVAAHLKATKAHVSLSTEDFSLTIADGISEFIKTRYLYPMSEGESSVFRALATALSRFLYQQPRIRDLLEQLAVHDPYSFYHGFRTAAYAVALNTKDKAWDIALGCILHDIGNLFISPLILNRKGALAEGEWKLMRKHPEEGHALLQNQHLSQTTLHMVLHHHERSDGQGYPFRLKRKDLSREVRLLSFVEVFAALTVPRAYQAPHSPEEAVQLMESSLKEWLDESLFQGLHKLLGLKFDVKKAI